MCAVPSGAPHPRQAFRNGHTQVLGTLWPPLCHVLVGPVTRDQGFHIIDREGPRAFAPASASVSDPIKVLEVEFLKEIILFSLWVWGGGIKGMSTSP